MILQGYLSNLNEGLPDSQVSEYVRKATATAECINSIIQFTRQYGEIGTL
ncbi:MAG: hypothetical protein LUQ50_00200 [Methanospirillum sp.]|nr:hypothetical protein [Methanospirillum sp.]MDD1727471.1 hypothetical protein [Methanospirillum sp.]